jgi:hyaluronoglucosaminidase
VGTAASAVAASRMTPARPRTAYVANYGSGTVTPIRTATGTAGDPITVGTGPGAAAITPNGKIAFVTNLGSGTVTPIRTATGTASDPIPVGTSPIAIAITPNGKTAYTANYGSGRFIPFSFRVYRSRV